jgi:hypothetical protein
MRCLYPTRRYAALVAALLLAVVAQGASPPRPAINALRWQITSGGGPGTGGSTTGGGSARPRPETRFPPFPMGGKPGIGTVGTGGGLGHPHRKRFFP